MKSPLRLLILQLLAIPIVIVIFKLPFEKPTLSIFANIVFWTIGLISLRYSGPNRIPVLLTSLQFLFTAVLPVTILRYISWGGDFNTSSILGVTGASWHSYSNISYSIFLLGSITSLVLTRLRK